MSSSLGSTIHRITSGSSSEKSCERSDAMPMRLGGSCRCGAVRFSVESHTPYPYQRCFCSICRKSASGGGYTINIMAVADTMKMQDRSAIRVWHAMIDGETGSAARHFCRNCGTPLWVFDQQ